MGVASFLSRARPPACFLERVIMHAFITHPRSQVKCIVTSVLIIFIFCYDLVNVDLPSIDSMKDWGTPHLFKPWDKVHRNSPNYLTFSWPFLTNLIFFMPGKPSDYETLSTITNLLINAFRLNVTKIYFNNTFLT